MKRKYILLMIAALTLMSAKVMQAQSTNLKKVAQTGLQFLKVDMSARAAGMASSYSMIGQDANAVFYNPAGLAYMKTTYDVAVTRTSWIADINYNAAAFAADFGNIGSFGISYISADYGKLVGTDIAPTTAGYVKTGSVDVGASAIGVAYARRLNDKFTVGGQVKWAQQHLGSSTLTAGKLKKNSVSGFAVDFGTVFYPGYIPSLRLGMSVRNFSQQFVYQEEEFDLPLNFRIGVAVDALDFFGGSQTNSLLFSVDAMHPRDYTERVHIGAEYWYMNMLALRVGYKTNYDTEGLSLGFGVHYNIAGMRLKFDYAYSAMDLFNGVNCITIGGAF